MKIIQVFDPALCCSTLERSGAEALPLILVNGEAVLTGRYPNCAEFALGRNQ